MSRLLYLKASPRARSHAVAVADGFVEAYKKSHPKDEVAVQDVFQLDLPPFDETAVTAKYTVMHGQQPAPEHKQRWGEVERTIRDFKAFDKYVFAVPMWNFGIPYRLKHYFDVIVQPTYTFRFDPAKGYEGLVVGKPALVVYSRGGAYGEGSGAEDYDLQKKYMELVLGFMGFENVQSILVEPTLRGGEEDVQRVRRAALEKAQQLARDF